MGNERLKVMVKEKGPRILLAVGLIGAALLCPIASIAPTANVNAQSPTESTALCTDEELQVANVVREIGEKEYGIINLQDLVALANLFEKGQAEIGDFTLLAKCYNQVVQEGCPPEGAKVFPRCKRGLGQCGPFDGQELRYVPGDKKGRPTGFLTRILGGNIEPGGDLGTYKLGGSCRVKAGLDEGWIEREDFFK